MLFLASKSPRRRELLKQLGIDYSVLDVEVVEEPAPGEQPEEYVRRVAREKAGAAWLEVASVPKAVVLSADTEVVLDGVIFGKPVDEDDAVRQLLRLSGHTHLVHTALCALDAGQEHEAISTTEVRFAGLTVRQAEAYVASGEAMGKAGSYAIQGRAAAFIERISGSYTGVMGLPLHETARVLARFGIG